MSFFSNQWMEHNRFTENPNTKALRNKCFQLGIDISEDTWDKAVERINRTSSCARLNLIQMKVLYHIHYSKTKLAKLYPNIDETCDHCNISKADLTHMFWSCTKLRQFWFSIFEILNSAFNLGIQPNPIMALFGVTGDDIHITKDKENALAFATLIARRRIILEWKSPIPPKLSLWLSDVMFFLKTEKI